MNRRRYSTPCALVAVLLSAPLAQSETVSVVLFGAVDPLSVQAIYDTPFWIPFGTGLVVDFDIDTEHPLQYSDGQQAHFSSAITRYGTSLGRERSEAFIVFVEDGYPFGTYIQHASALFNWEYPRPAYASAAAYPGRGQTWSASGGDYWPRDWHPSTIEMDLMSSPLPHDVASISRESLEQLYGGRELCVRLRIESLRDTRYGWVYSCMNAWVVPAPEPATGFSLLAGALALAGLARARLKAEQEPPKSLSPSNSERTYTTKHGTVSTMKTSAINADRPLWKCAATAPHEPSGACWSGSPERR